MMTQVDAFLEKLIYVVAPIVFVAAGLFVWLKHDDIITASACAIVAGLALIMKKLHR